MRGGNEALRRLALAVLLLAAGAGLARAQASQAGTSAAQFLKIGAGARGAAMADAQAALADDAYAAYYNPAGLVVSTRPLIGAMHAQYFQGAKFEYGSFVLPFGVKDGRAEQAWAFSVANLGVSGIERRVEDTDQPAGLFDAADYSYGLSYARWFGDSLSLGATGKLVRSRIDVVSGDAVAADVGARWRLGTARPLYLAAAVRNMGGSLKLGDQSSGDPLPSAVVVGAAAELFAGLKAEADLIKYRDDDARWAVGGEYTHALAGSLSGSLRAGYNNQRSDIDGTTGITLGAGLNLPGLSFDFAWVPFGDLGNTFRYSLLVRF